MEADVLRADDRRFEAMRKGDWAALDAALSDDLTYVHSTARQESKAEHIANLRAGKPHYRGIIIAGDPESCIRGVQLYEEAGVDQVILITQTESIPHERALSSIEMFGKQVIPAYRAGARATPVTAGA